LDPLFAGLHRQSRFGDRHVWLIYLTSKQSDLLEESASLEMAREREFFFVVSQTRFHERRELARVDA
jgi:hypothetical protein